MRGSASKRSWLLRRLKYAVAFARSGATIEQVVAITGIDENELRRALGE
jgi:hypothetical protein